MQRALTHDGLLPNPMTKSGKHRRPTTTDIRAMKAFIETNRNERTSFDIIVEGTTPGDYPKRAAAQVRRWAKAGATRLIEAMWEARGLDLVLERIRQGPPRVE